MLAVPRRAGLHNTRQWYRGVPSINHRRCLRTQPAIPPITVGIRCEDPSRIWERRCPITPDDVASLIESHNGNVKVLVQPCDRRVFHLNEFIKAGAEPRQDLSASHITVGIKETPVDDLLTSPAPPGNIPRTHFMFSHTAKGQPYNRPLLSRFLHGDPSHGHSEPSLLPTLIDYELLVDERGRRTVGFGWFAGVAGVLESLSSMAHSHLEIGIASPFLYTPRPHTLPTLNSLRAGLRVIGEKIMEQGTPKSLGPFVIGLTGSGNVSQGCLSMLDELPISKVAVKDLHELVTNENTDLHKIYLVHASPGEYLTRLDGLPYERGHYYASPHSYRSDFAVKVAPYLTLLLNGVGWSAKFPRLMTNAQLPIALERAQALGGARFTNIGDISCDVEGGLEFLTRSSTLSSPFYHIHPETTTPSGLPSVSMMAVDILPATLPLDASKQFSKVFAPYLSAYIDSLQGKEKTHDEALRRSLPGATIVAEGKLKSAHKWLEDGVQVWRKESRGMTNRVVAGQYEGRRILMLGSGMVAGPAVAHIAKSKDVRLVIGSNSESEAQALKGTHENVSYEVIDVQDTEAVSRLISENDVIISLLPVSFHPAVAELCIQHRKHLVTASYISPAMKELHPRALSADILLLNEIGLDPGIDHCSAISLISRLHAQKKKVVSFVSFCGGLPAPECSNVPLRYKFSWSPRGVLIAALNDAQYRLKNENFDIEGENLLRSYFSTVPIEDHEDVFEGLANRNSLPYNEVYNLGPVEEMRTVLRGTLRYRGFASLMHSFKLLGLLEPSKPILLRHWSSLVEQSLGLGCDENISANIIRRVPPGTADAVFEALDWLSLVPCFDLPRTPDHNLPPVPTHPLPPIDLFSILLAHKLQYSPGERDMVVLAHELITSDEEVHTSTLVAYGNEDGSAMARCVGLPVAFAALRVLEGAVPVRGVAGPTHPSVYVHVLEELEKVGLGMREESRKGGDSSRTIEQSLQLRVVA